MVFQDVAQVCLNGHVINSASKTYDYLNRDYCPECGSPTITECKNCGGEIEGRMILEDENLPYHEPPRYCHNCGHPFPWTEMKIKAAHDLIQELEDLSSKERDILSKSINDLINDTPSTELAATRAKKIISKLGTSSLELFKRIAFEIVTDKAKEYLGLW